MTIEFRDLCILIPDYELLLEAVQAGGLENSGVAPGRGFSTTMLIRKGLVEARDGYVVPTILGQAVACARRADVGGTAVYLTASGVVAAAASFDQQQVE
ncbi:hypothetical protein [Planctomyces sp. SH-PL14]|jgi:hypothetical protein|uniref:hypothetical protein n=1 Tax=Planctomyces sp. SH-PL14 TaxID=1632864 RepID=UPI00078CB8F0|nr:hypothetical protein [Planctomyces sp. SH-PL14]AMV16432.1 hypothetical protein VT03_00990 [Planctomyces sp. SH-PL14]